MSNQNPGKLVSEETNVESTQASETNAASEQLSREIYFTASLAQTHDSTEVDRVNRIIDGSLLNTNQSETEDSNSSNKLVFGHHTYSAKVGIEIDGITYIFGTDAAEETLTGTEGVDHIVGGPDGTDSLTGIDNVDAGLGDDSVWGLDGDDTILGGEGLDKLSGGDDNDTIDGGLGDDQIWGEDGNDTLTGAEGNDVIVGGAGIDTIDGGADNDNIWGGDGQDIINGGLGDDKIRGEHQADEIDGGDGNDTIWGDSYILDDADHGDDIIRGGLGDDLIAGGGGIDNIEGGEGADFIWGDEGGSYGTTFGDDVLSGGLGDDYLMGEGGNDVLNGDEGNDTLRGDASYLASNLHGDDELYGGAGDDKLMGGAGNDLLVGGIGSNEYQFSQGSGDDRIVLTDGANDVIQLGSGIARGDVDFVREYNPPANDPTQGYGDDFTINFANTGSSIFLEDFYTLSYSTVLSEIRFADGSVVLYDEFTNSAPIVENPVGSLSHLEDDALNFNVSNGIFFDIDNDALTITLSSPDSARLFEWLSFDGTTLTGTPLNEHVGFYEITLTAFDGYESVSDTFDLEVVNTNDVPEVGNQIPDTQAQEDSGFSYTVPANTFFDVDVGDSLTLSARSAGGGNLPGWLSFNSSNNTFTGTPGNSDVGTVDIEVTATDTEGATVSDTFRIEVLNVNDTPTVGVGVGDVVTPEDLAFNYTIPGDAFNDIDGDTLTYTATLSGGGALPAWLSFNQTTGQFTGTPRNDDVGVIDIVVSAIDGSGASASDSFSLQVENTNDAPTVDNGISNLSAMQGSSFSYTIPNNAFDDVDVGDSLTYTLDSTSGADTSWLSFDGASGSFSGTPDNTHVGVATIQVSAVDSAGASVAETFNLEVVNTNDAPRVDAGIADTSVAEDSALNFVIPNNAFVDDDGDSLTYTAEQTDGSALPGWLSFDPGTGTFSGTPLNEDVGILNILVRAADPSGSEASDSFSIDVQNTNDAPVVDAGIADYDITPGTTFSYIIPSNAFSDPDGDTLTLTANLQGGGPLPAWLEFTGTSIGSSSVPDTDAEGTVVVIGAYDGVSTVFTEFTLI